MGLEGHLGGTYGAGRSLMGPLCCPTELMFLETSALTGENVEEAFLKCARTILNKIESGKEGGFGVWGVGSPPPHSSAGFGVPTTHPSCEFWGPPHSSVGFGVPHSDLWVLGSPSPEVGLLRGGFWGPPHSALWVLGSPPFSSVGFGVPFP